MPSDLPPYPQTSQQLSPSAMILRVPPRAQFSCQDSQPEIDEALPPLQCRGSTPKDTHIDLFLRYLAGAILGDPNDEHKAYLELASIEDLDSEVPDHFETDLQRINKRMQDAKFYKGLKVSGLDSHLKSVVVELVSRRTGKIMTIRLSTLLRPAKAALYETPSGLPLNSQNEISSIGDIHAVKQGNLGDCYFIATVCSLALQHPEAIFKLIRDNHNGTYSVLFPMLRGEAITVAATTFGDTQFFVQNGRSTWLNVLEKAHRQLTRTELLDKGGAPDSVMALMTGRKAIRTHMTDFAGDLRKLKDVIEPALREHKLLVCDSRVKYKTKQFRYAGGPIQVVNPDGKTTMIDLPAPHAFNVLEYKPAVNIAHSQIGLRNPWGFNLTVDGEQVSSVFYVTLEDFLNRFYSIYVGSAD